MERRIIVTRFSLILVLLLVVLLGAIFTGVFGDTKVNTTLSSGSLSDGLIGHWTFDGPDLVSNVVDNSGTGNTGTIAGQTSTTTAPGAIGQGLLFDGVDDSVHVPTNSSLNNIEQLTVAAWIYPNSLGEGNEAHIISKTGSGLTGGWGLTLCDSSATGCNGDQLRFSSDWSTQDGIWRTLPGDGPVLGEWTHIVVTYDNSSDANEPIFYFNGVLAGSGEAQTPLGSTINDAVRSICIGNAAQNGSCNTNHSFDGIIDDVRLYNRALSTKEVKRLYSIGIAPTAIPDLDSVGTLKEWHKSGNWTTDVGVDEWFDSATKGSLTQGTTGSQPSVASNWQNGLDGVSFAGGTHLRRSGGSADVESGAGGAWTIAMVASIPTSGNTIHASGEKGDYAFYINAGELRHYDRSSSPETTYFTSGYDKSGGDKVILVYGVDSSGNGFTFINNVDYSSGSSAGTQTGRFGYLGRSNPGGNSTMVIGEVAVWTEDLSGSAGDIFTILNNRWNIIGRSILTINTTLSSGSLSDGLIGHWTFDGPDMIENITDSSGNGNDGNLTNQTPTTTTIGVLGQALEFDGDDDYIDIDNLSSYFTNEKATFCTWVKRVDHTPSSGGNTGSWYFNTSSANNHYPWIDGSIYDGSFKTTREVVGTGNVADRTKWHHVCITREAGANGWKFYQNGTVIHTASGGTWQLGTSIKLGESSNNSYNFHGSMDDVRLYNRVLSADEIQRLYDLGG